ncbi:O-methylsterigmatocystin oxidoreductase [Termitomyces sp. J132]|nr:O-methylsterigmatocystin oxidoreductase [Termitomyces sp. J132]
MLRRLLDQPDDFAKHLRDLTGTIIMSVTYGIDVLPENDPYIAIAETAMHGMSEATIPGRFLVDFIPLLKYVPAWMPGVDFQRKAKAWRDCTMQLVENPFAVVQQKLAKGEAMEPSFVSYCLGNMDSSGGDIDVQQRIIRDTAASLYEAGSDTTVSALNTFVLAMVCHPEVQRKAQTELDRVLPPGHLPDFSDEQALPYLSAIIKEVLRWQPVVPLAVPHYATNDDTYNNYHIPAGSTVIGNAWAMLHDESIYPDPDTFNPDRFMKDGKLNPDIRDPSMAFGFGRRFCPGRHMAISSIWIAAASILTTFHLSKAVDNDGRVIEPSQEYLSGLIAHPLPFKCMIRPRSTEAVSLICSAAAVV